MGRRLLVRQKDVGLGVTDDVAEDAGWVVGMCQESMVVSNCVAVFGSAGREIGVLVGGGSRGRDGIESVSNVCSCVALCHFRGKQHAVHICHKLSIKWTITLR